MFYHMRQDDRRTKGIATRTEYGVQWSAGIPSAYPSYTTVDKTTAVAKGDTRVMFYNNTGPFRPGAFAVNPVDQRKETLSCSTSELIGYHLYSGYKLLGKRIVGDVGAFLGQAGSYGITDAPPADATLSARLYERSLVKSSQASSEAGVMIGELKQTAEMLINPINSLARILNKLRSPGSHKPRNRRKHSVTYLTDFWLVNRFGILPLLADITSLCDTFRKKSLREWSPIMKKGSSRRTVSRTVGNSIGSLYGYPVELRTTVATELIYRACVFYQRNYAEEGLQQYGLSLFQWPGVAWELIPLSFMVDRVIGIGDWLERIRPKYGFMHLGATISRKQITSSIMEALRIQNVYSSPTWSPCNHFTRRVSEMYVRDTPGPLSTSVPTVNINLGGLIKTMDHVSLAWQRLPRLHKF